MNTDNCLGALSLLAAIVVLYKIMPPGMRSIAWERDPDAFRERMPLILHADIARDLAMEERELQECIRRWKAEHRGKEHGPDIAVLSEQLVGTKMLWHIHTGHRKKPLAGSKRHSRLSKKRFKG